MARTPKSVTDNVKTIQSMIGAEEDGMWGKETSARFSEALRIMQANLNIRSTGRMDQNTANALRAAMDQKSADGKPQVNPEFGRAVLALYDRKRDGNPFINTIHVHNDMDTAPMTKTASGAYAVEGGANRFDMAKLMPGRAPAPAAPAEAPAPEREEAAAIQTDVRPAADFAAVSRPAEPIVVPLRGPSGTFNYVSPGTVPPRTLDPANPSMNFAPNSPGATIASGPNFKSDMLMMATNLKNLRTSTQTLASAAEAYGIYDGRSSNLASNKDGLHATEFAARNGLNPNERFDTGKPEQLTALMTRLVAFENNVSMNDLPPSWHERIKASADKALGVTQDPDLDRQGGTIPEIGTPVSSRQLIPPRPGLG